MTRGRHHHRGTGRRRIGALALVVAVFTAACTVPDSEGDRERKPPSEKPSIIDPGTIDIGGPTTTPAAPRGNDVPDKVFPNLGDPRIDVEHYDVTVTAQPREGRIQGHVTLELRPTGDSPLTNLTLDLRGPSITQATVDELPAEATVDGYEWTITPQPPGLLPKRTTTIEIDYAGVPDQTPFPPFDGISIGWQPDDQGGWFTMSEPYGTSTWVPVNDHPSDKATWDVTLITPDDVTGVSNGHLVSHESSDGATRWVWEQSEPMASYLVLAAVGKYDLVQRKGVDGTDVTFAFPTNLSEAKRNGFSELDQIVDFFDEQFGPLPGPDFGAIVVDRKDFTVALETQTRPLFSAEDVRENKVPNLAHELAHQWFGNDVSLSTWRDLWLNEGFATYADWLYQDSQGVPIEEIAEREAELFADTGLTVRDRQAAATFDFVIYDRGALTLYALGKTVGEDTLRSILRTWSRRYSGKTATTEDFVRLSSEIAGRDLTSFFRSWLDEVPQPKLPD